MAISCIPCICMYIYNAELNIKKGAISIYSFIQAKDLLRRVEERDLYTCSAKKRVAKFCPMVKFLKPENSAYALCKLCGDQLEKDPEVKALKDMYDDHKLCQKFDGMVHDNLLLEEKSIIQKDKIWTEVLNFSMTVVMTSTILLCIY